MRIVAHVDMDAFFAAVEERYNLHRGFPIVVDDEPKDDTHGWILVDSLQRRANMNMKLSAFPRENPWYDSPGMPKQS